MGMSSPSGRRTAGRTRRADEQLLRSTMPSSGGWPRATRRTCRCSPGRSMRFARCGPLAARPRLFLQSRGHRRVRPLSGLEGQFRGRSPEEVGRGKPAPDVIWRRFGVSVRCGRLRRRRGLRERDPRCGGGGDGGDRRPNPITRRRPTPPRSPPRLWRLPRCDRGAGRARRRRSDRRLGVGRERQSIDHERLSDEVRELDPLSDPDRYLEPARP